MDPSSGGGLKSQSSTWGRSGKRWCPGGSSFATASTHAYQQCLAITPPAVTRPSAHLGCRGVSDNPEAAPHRRVGMSRVESERRASSERGRAIARRASPSESDIADLEEGWRGGSFATASAHAYQQRLAITPPPVTTSTGGAGSSGDRLDSETNDIRPAQDRDRWPPRFVSGRQWTHHRLAD